MILKVRARNYACILLLLLAALTVVLPATAQNKVTGSVLTAKLYPLLHQLQRRPAVHKPISKEPVLQQLWALQQGRGQRALAQCGTAACLADSLKWTQVEIDRAGDAFIRLYADRKAVRSLVGLLRQKQAYPLYDSLADSSYLRKAWADAAKGINRIFDIYIKGDRPPYGAIDSISFKKGDEQFRRQLTQGLRNALAPTGGKTFYDGPLQYSLFVLGLNGRDEAARFVPLEGGMNQAPYEKIKQTDFSKYPYSVILIPGQGPEQDSVALHPNGANRCRMGLERWKAGLAPFIVVSGGNVHPFRTPYNEAVEMKKYMVEQLGVPADVIFIEPDARHTTTNLRNTARMIYRFGMPAAQPVLIVTDASQSSYMVQRMNKVLQRDLGCLPYASIKKLSAEETVFVPALHALQPNPSDPLDP